MKPTNEAEHTPIPWEVEPKDKKTWTRQIVSPDCGTSMGGFKTKTCVGTLNNISDCDTAFIERAVNSHEALLEAAKTALMWLEGQQHLYGLTESGARKYQNDVDLLKKAIAKAEEGRV